ncbi:threonine/homoserine/homoserine lactone efflux protein [Dysgonomonas alginatilytica]|uniref:Threonine/homoserine/homoserine lactone efflux protein n=1 Tax=Dysgonomonas alginatilytica TaxID=1605892 RepID=A0A2V3PV05_9BACT|nr:LysE family transporter [Dysgonomonas alginatilytica]PXV68131.1 threonine/homoserine/homoserine lactone efflux protein [Dysgonomonas alginatilytica]
MDFSFLYKGFILGFSVAAPVGPIGVLCINRTLHKGYASGLTSGLGAATADLIYGCIAGFGLTIVSNFLVGQQIWFQVIGLAFLFYTGIKTLTRNTSQAKFSTSYNKGLLNDYTTTFLLTITNPLTILFFLAVFAGLGLSNTKQDKFASILLVSGVFIGSAAWWLLLSGFTHKLKKMISDSILKRIDLFSGLLILFFAFILLYDLITG